MVLINGIHFEPERQDLIRWVWTANGEYSASLAYRAHLLGSFSTFLAVDRTVQKWSFGCSCTAMARMHTKPARAAWS
jgi:hypothetical protein